uniref:Reverse transcriptase domain-containing protein n=1 Tax=Tanacetum cinerariifolium TaxID=118510 RepID=A0A6L2N3B8_TANCI|nr:reverse transcriptase domain-containing protein [Tanacetum cinerariifolium]
MSAMENTTPIVTTVTKLATNPRDADATPRVNIWEFCEEYYEDILPIIMDKVCHDRRKDVHTRLDFREGPRERTREDSHHSSTRARTTKPEWLKVQDRLRYGDRHVLDRLGHRRQSAFDRLSETYSPSTTKSRPQGTDSRDHPQGRSRPHRLDTSKEDRPKDSERFCSVRESYDDSFSHSYRDGNRSLHMKRRRDNESPLSNVSRSDSSNGRYRRSRPCQNLPGGSIGGKMGNAYMVSHVQLKPNRRSQVEIHNIKQKDGETIEDFMERFKVETGRMKGALECMRISEFMHGVNNPELTKRLNKHVPKTMEEMMITTTAFIRGETAAASKKKGHASWKAHDQSKRQHSNKRSDFQGHSREGRGSNRFTPLTRTPKEILAAEAGKFQPPPLMSKIGKKETTTKDKPTAVYMIQSCQRTTRQKVTQSFERVKEITFPPLAVSSRTEGLLIIEAEMGGHMIHRMLLVIIGDANHSTRAWINFMIVRSLSPYNGIIGRPGIRAIQAVPSTVHGMLKFPVEGWIVIIHSTVLIPTECTLMITSSALNTGSTSGKDTHMSGKRKRARPLNVLRPYKQRSKTSGGRDHERGLLPQLAVQSSHEVYVDDLVVKSYTEAEMIRDIEETFRTLQKISMKLNLKNCAITTITADNQRGLESQWEVGQSERFLSKSAKKSLPLFKTLKKCIKKSDFHWTAEAEQAFKQLKQHLSELPLSVAPKPNEELIIYLSATHGAIREHNITYKVRTSVKGQILADFLIEMPNENPQAAPAAKTQQEPWTLFTDGSSCVDRSGAGLILTNPEGIEFTYALRFQFAASNNEAEYEALIAGLWMAAQIGVKNVHVSVDFKLVANQVLGTYVVKEDYMVKYLDKVKSLVRGFTNFSISQVPRSKNKKADALSKIASTSFATGRSIKDKPIKEKEVATMVEEDGPTWMTPIVEYLKEGTLPSDKKEARKLRIKARQYELIEGILNRRLFLTPWLRCVGPLQVEYVIREIHEGSCSMYAGPRLVVAKAIRLGYYWPTMHQDARPGKFKFLIVAMDYFTKWIEAIAVATITGGQVKKFVWDNIVCCFGLPVKHSQSNGLVERANQSLGEGIKARLAVIPIEIGMPTYRTTAVDVVSNDEELRLNLDLLEERRECAVICEANAKSKMTKYYNARVRGVTFRPGDFVYHSNDASHVVAGGKLGPKWEGPYEVTEALGDGAYKLRSMDGTILPRTWNIANLKRCYL